MKYQIYTCDTEGHEYEAQLNIRSDAKLQNVYVRCVNEIIKVMRECKAISGTVQCHIEMPNIWTNGGFPSIWFTANDRIFDVGIHRDGLAFV